MNWLAVALDFTIVVLGVFLGLQAANWNEGRKDRQEERRYYKQIVDDLRRDQGTLKLALRRADGFDAAAENTLRALSTGVPQGNSAGRFAVNIHYAGFLYIPQPTRRTYDELISTGNLGLLRNEQAKRAIAEYYGSFDDLRQWDELLRLQQGRYWNATSGVLPRSVLKTAIRLREPLLSNAEAVKILADLAERESVPDILISMAAHQERVRRDSEQLLKEGGQLIGQLNQLTD